MIFNRIHNVIIGIVAVEIMEKVYLYLIVGALVQRLFFQDVDGGHLRYFGLNGLLASN